MRLALPVYWTLLALTSGWAQSNPAPDSGARPYLERLAEEARRGRRGQEELLYRAELAAAAPDSWRAQRDLLRAKLGAPRLVWSRPAVHGSAPGTRARSSVESSPDGRWLAVASYEGVQIYDLARGEAIGSLPLRATCLAFAAKANALATGDRRGRVQLWDPQSGRRLIALDGHDEAVRAVALSPNGEVAVSVGADDCARRWDVTTRRQEGLLELAGPSACLVTEDGDALVLANGVAWAWERQAPEASPLAEEVAAIAHGPDRSFWLSTPAGLVSLRRDGGKQTVLAAPGKLVAAAAAAGVVVLEDEGNCRVFDLQSGERLAQLDATPPLALSTDGAAVYETTPEGLVVYSVETQAQTLRGPRVQRQRGLAWSPDGAWIARGFNLGTVEPLGTVEVVEASSGATVWTLAFEDGVESLAFGPQGKRLVATGRGRATLWDLATGEVLRDLTPLVRRGGGGPSRAVWSRDGARLAISEWGGTVTEIEVASGATRWTANLRPGSVYKTVAVGRDAEDRVLVLNTVGLLALDPTTGEPQDPPLLRGDFDDDATLVSADGRVVVAGVEDTQGQGGAARVRVHDWDDPFDLLLDKHAGRPLALSADGSRLLTSGLQVIALLDYQHVQQELLGSSAAAAFAPSGDQVALGGWPADPLRVVDLRGATDLVTTRAHSRSRHDLMTWSPNGRRWAWTEEGSARGTVHVAAFDLADRAPSQVLAQPAGADTKWMKHLTWGLDGAHLLAVVEGAIRDEDDYPTSYELVCWDATSGRVRWQVTREEPPRALAVGPAGRVAIAHGERITVFDGAGTQLAELPGVRDTQTLAFSADGARLLSTNGKQLVLASLDGGEIVARRSSHEVKHLASLSNGRWVSGADWPNGGHVRVWSPDLATHTTLRGHGGHAWVMDVWNDSVVAGSRERDGSCRVTLWSAADGGDALTLPVEAANDGTTAPLGQVVLWGERLLTVDVRRLKAWDLAAVRAYHALSSAEARADAEVHTGWRLVEGRPQRVSRARLTAVEGD